MEFFPKRRKAAEQLDHPPGHRRRRERAAGVLLSNTRRRDSKGLRLQPRPDAHRGSWGPIQPRKARDQCHTGRRRWAKMLRCRRPGFRPYGNRGNQRRRRPDTPPPLSGQTLRSKEQCPCHTRRRCQPTVRCYRPGFRPHGNSGDDVFGSALRYLQSTWLPVTSPRPPARIATRQFSEAVRAR